MTINLKILLCVFIITVLSETKQISAKPQRHNNHNDGNHQNYGQSLFRFPEQGHDDDYNHTTGSHTTTTTNRHRHHGHNHSEEWHRRYNHGHHRSTPSPVESSAKIQVHNTEWLSKHPATSSLVENSPKPNPEWNSQSPTNNHGNHQHNGQSPFRDSVQGHTHGHNHSEEWHRRHNQNDGYHHNFHRTTSSSVDNSHKHNPEWNNLQRSTPSTVESSKIQLQGTDYEIHVRTAS
jgi:hypothetical protein